MVGPVVDRPPSGAPYGAAPDGCAYRRPADATHDAATHAAFHTPRLAESI